MELLIRAILLDIDRKMLEASRNLYLVIVGNSLDNCIKLYNKCTSFGVFNSLLRIIRYFSYTIETRSKHDQNTKDLLSIG